MDTKEFTNFDWEEKWIVLDMQYFYFRKYSFSIYWRLNWNFMFKHFKPLSSWELAVAYHS